MGDETKQHKVRLDMIIPVHSFAISDSALTRGDDYKNHVKCISEDQKYGGKNYEARANKGDVKQQQWVQVKYSKLLHLNSLPVCLGHTSLAFLKHYLTLHYEFIYFNMFVDVKMIK